MLLPVAAVEAVSLAVVLPVLAVVLAVFDLDRQRLPRLHTLSPLAEVELAATQTPSDRVSAVATLLRLA